MFLLLFYFRIVTLQVVKASGLVPTRPLGYHSNGIQLVQLLPSPTVKVESPMEDQMTNVYLFIEETNGMTIPVRLPLLQCVN